MEYLKSWSDPRLTAKFQNFCGIHLRKLENVSGQEKNNPETAINQQNLDRFQQKKLNNNSIINSYDESNVTERRQRELDVTDSSCDSETMVTKDSNRTTHLEFKINYRFLYYLFSFSSSLGNEVFYLMFYPYCVWNLDSLIGRDTCFVWCLCMYLGQATKDYLLWPRPASPPVVRLENEFLQESSMPSTHAMSAAAIPFMLAYLTLARYQFPAFVAWTIAVCWCSLVCLSRLYLGVHSVLDVVVGVLYSFLIMFLTTPYLLDFDTYQQTATLAPVVTFVTSLALCTICYPSSKDGKNSAKGDAVQIVAVTAGVSLATWLNYQLGYTTEPDQNGLYEIAYPTLHFVIVSVLRLLVGGVVLGIILFVMKKLSVLFFSYIFGLEKPDKKHPYVETGYKFVTYYILGIAIMFFIPIVHDWLGIGRPALYKEVM